MNHKLWTDPPFITQSIISKDHNDPRIHWLELLNEELLKKELFLEKT